MTFTTGRNLSGTFSKTAGTTLSFQLGLGIDQPAGSLVVAAVAFDNLTATTPTVTLAHDRASDPNGTAFTLQSITTSPDATAGGGLLLAVFTFITGEPWLASQTFPTYTATFSGSITAKAIIVGITSGVTFDRVLYSNASAAVNSLGPAFHPQFPGQSGFLAIAIESATAPTFVPTNAWPSPASTTTTGTTGGSAITNIQIAGRFGPIYDSGSGTDLLYGMQTATGDKAVIFILFAEPSGPVTYQVSGTAAIASDAVGAIFRTHLITAVAWNYAALGV